MLKVQVIIGTTRPNRVSPQVGAWVTEIAGKRSDMQVELIDVADLHLPLFDEPGSPAYMGNSTEHGKKWAAKVDEADAYVFVAGEYNHGVTGALKNAIDFVYKQWNNKAVGFVSYGSNGGSRAVEHLRQIAGEVQMADVREQVLLYLGSDFENMSVFKPQDGKEEQLNKMLDQLVLWGEAMKSVREKLTK